jgi:hypothetical protein
MPNDFLKREPSKTEKMLYELAMAQHQMEKGLLSTSTVAMALAVINKIKPEELAELMANGDDKIKEYSNKVNEAIKKLEEAKKPNTDPKITN